jgi:hypothetical protein
LESGPLLPVAGRATLHMPNNPFTFVIYHPQKVKDESYEKVKG